MGLFINDQQVDPVTALFNEQIQTFRALRKQGDIDLLLHCLRDNLHRIAGEFHSPRLFVDIQLPTYQLIENYFTELSHCLTLLCTDKWTVTKHTKIALLEQSLHTLGTSALVLSGGGTLGIYHLGVIKALIDADLLPNVISGASMGSFIAGTLACHNDEEILVLIDNIKNTNHSALKLLSLSEMFEYKAIMSSEHLFKCIHEQVQNYTFAEAYERTGRIVNISVSPTRVGQKPRILNYITAPELLISYACLASCAIPGIFSPVILKKKLPDGSIVDCMSKERWADGSVHQDIPIARLSRLHNVNHFIVSQTNPHILPFVKNRERKGMIPFIKDLISSTIVNITHSTVGVLQRRITNNKLQFILDRADATLGQEYQGDVNIHPDYMLHEHLGFLKNPSAESLPRFVLLGQHAANEKMLQIDIQTRLSRLINQYRMQLINELKH